MPGAMIENLPPAVRQSLNRRRRGHRRHPAVDIPSPRPIWP